MRLLCNAHIFLLLNFIPSRCVRGQYPQHYLADPNQMPQNQPEQIHQFPQDQMHQYQMQQMHQQGQHQFPPGHDPNQHQIPRGHDPNQHGQHQFPPGHDPNQHGQHQFPPWHDPNQQGQHHFPPGHHDPNQQPGYFGGPDSNGLPKRYTDYFGDQDEIPFGPEIPTNLSPELQERVLERVNEFIPEIADAIVDREKVLDGLESDHIDEDFDSAAASFKSPKYLIPYISLVLLFIL